VGGALQSPRDLERVVTHELVHAVVASAAPRGVPVWLNEGLASYMESSDHTWAAEAIGRGTAAVPLEQLTTGFAGLDEGHARVAYAESEIAAEILVTRLGPQVGAFVQMVGSGTAVDQALMSFQIQPDAFHGEWRRRVRLQ
jgi:hypothetical protein